MSTDTGSTRTWTSWVGGALVMVMLAVLVVLVARGGVVATRSDGDRPVLVPVAPCRLADTRSGSIGPNDTLQPGETITIATRGTNGECTLPTDAVALSLNVTAVDASAPTYITIWPSGPLPNASSLNPAPGFPPAPNAVTTPLSDGGGFNVYNDRGTVDLIVDVNGYFVHHDHDDRYLRPGDLGPQTGMDHAIGPQVVDLAGPAQSVVSVVLDSPAPGFVVVTANGYTHLGTAGIDQVRCSITSGSVAIDFNREFWTDDHGIEGGDPYVPFSSTSVFPVLGGSSTTYRLVCAQHNGDVEIRDSSITALWVSSRY